MSQFHDEIVRLLNDCGMFDKFSANDLRIAAPYFNLSSMAAGEVIFREGDAGSFMCIVCHGTVSVVKTNSDGGRVDLATVSRGRALGEMAVLDGDRRSATCVVATDCTLLTLARTSLDKMLLEQPRTAARVVIALAASLSRRLRLSAGQLVDHLE